MKKWLNGNIVDMSFEEEGKQKNRREELPPIEIRIINLKEQLSETDYVVLKIVEGESTKEDYKDILKLRKGWRKEINRLEKELKRNNN